MMAVAALRVLHVPDLREAFARALDADLPAPLRAELQFRLGLHLDDTGEHQDEKWSAIRGAVEDLDERSGLAAWAMLALGMPTEPTDHDVAERAGWLDRALATVPDIEDVSQRQLVLGKVAMGRVLTGDRRWTGLADQLIAASGPADWRLANAYFSLGLGAGHAGHHALARESLRRALDVSADVDAPDAMDYRSRAALLVVSYLRGEWEGQADAIPEVLDGLSSRSERVMAEVVAVCLDLAGGNLDGASERLQALATTDGTLLPLIVDALLRLAVARGEAEDALTDTAEYVELWESRGMWPIGVRAVPALTEAMLAVGRADDAAALVDRYADAMDGMDAPLVDCALPHARGLLASAEGKWTRATGEFTAAAAAYDKLPAPYEAARAREQAAGTLHAADDPDAATMLAAAIHAYEQLGARWDLERAARTARQWGVEVAPRPQSRRGPRGYGPTLSPREREVAELAATGLTNRDIANELFVSPKTVEKHLASALRKLGLRSRTALAAHLSAAAREA